MTKNTSKTQLVYQWRFKEQDGDWSPWYWCDSDEALTHENRSDEQVRYVG